MFVVDVVDQRNAETTTKQRRQLHTENEETDGNNMNMQSHRKIRKSFHRPCLSLVLLLARKFVGKTKSKVQLISIGSGVCVFPYNKKVNIEFRFSLKTIFLLAVKTRACVHVQHDN